MASNRGTGRAIMSMIGARRLAVILTCILITGAVTVQPASAAAATVQVLQFNACDQWQNREANSKCWDNNSQARADAILRSISSWGADLVTLQEVCRITYDYMAANLGSSWRGYFVSTYTQPPPRCGDQNTSWGSALFARTTTISAPTLTVLNSSGFEPRRLLCNDVVVGVPLRICTTHLAANATNETYLQSFKAANAVNGAIAGGLNNAIIGGDFNLNVRDCYNANSMDGLRPWYYGALGSCGNGYGQFLEADAPYPNAAGPFNEDTQGTRKLDYVFANFQHTANLSGDATLTEISDHDPLRAQMTVYNP